MSLQTQPTNLPECSSVVSRDWSVEAADAFDPRSFTYYQDKWPYWVVGGIMGLLTLATMFAFIGWLCSLCWRRHSWKFQLEKMEQEAISNPNDPYNFRKPKRSRHGCLLYCMSFMLLVTIGLSVWGLVEAILASNNKVSLFWDIVDDAEAQLNDLILTSNRTLDDLEGINNSLGVIMTGSLPDLLSAQQEGGDGLAGFVLRAVAGLSDAIQQTAQQVQSQVAQVLADGRSAVATVQQEGMHGIQEFESDWRGPSSSVEDTWRWVVLIVFFVLVILVALVAAALAGWGRWPRTAAGFTVVLYLLTTILMIMGAGLLNGMSEVGGDACLYGEGFAMQLVQESSMDSATKEKVLGAIEYYTGIRHIPDEEVPKQLFGLDTAAVAEAARAADPVLSYLVSSDGREALAEAGLSNEAMQQLQALPALINGTVKGVNNFNNQVLRKAWKPVYSRAKTLLCCDIDSGLDRLSIAWTADGIACLILAVLISLRIRYLVVWDF